MAVWAFVVLLLDRVAKVSSWGGCLLGSLGIAFMTGLITVDVLGRYLLGMPTYVATEFSEYLCVIITFIGLSYVSRTGRQIEVTILYDRLPPRLRRYVRVFTQTLALAFVSYFAYETALPTLLDFRLGTRSLTFVHTPLWLIGAFVPLGLGMLGVETLAQWLQLIFGVRKDVTGKDSSTR
jgi:TRAP-type C4-dicarboxylate transport system permease small subunit